MLVWVVFILKALNNPIFTPKISFEDQRIFLCRRGYSFDSAPAEACKLDEMIQRNEEFGLLAGLLSLSRTISAQLSHVLEVYTSLYNATAIKKIKELGGIVVGKTNLDEFGFGSTTEGSAFWFLVLLSVCFNGLYAFF